MFDQTFVNAHAQTRRPWTVAISLALQAALIAIALIAPLLHIASLEPPPKIPIWLPLENLDLKLKPEVTAAPHPAPATPRPVFQLAELRAPTAVPPHIDLSPDAPELVNSTMTIGPSGPLLTFSLPEPAIQPQTQPQPQPRQVVPSAPVHIGSGVQSAKLLFGPKPAYPPLARTTRTQGTVKIQAIIARDGSIGNLQVLSGPPLLVSVAIEAVQRWRYQPTLLNGEPVEVITEIDVNFTLSQ